MNAFCFRELMSGKWQGEWEEEMMNKNTQLEATGKGRNEAAELAFDWEPIKN